MSEFPSHPSSTVIRNRSPKLAEKVVHHFVERIQSGAMVPGSKLPTEFDITREHGVSRAVVREALSKLQAAGLVETRQGIGTFVVEGAQKPTFRIDPATVLTIADVLMLLELRVSFEAESAYLAALRRSDEQLRRISDFIEVIQRQIESGGETRSHDFNLHLEIAAATGNRYFVDLLNHLGMAILPRARIDLRVIAGDNTHQYLTRSNQEHREIHQAIARRDPESARAAMRLHLNNSRERLKKLYEQVEPEVRNEPREY